MKEKVGRKKKEEETRSKIIHVRMSPSNVNKLQKLSTFKTNQAGSRVSAADIIALALKQYYYFWGIDNRSI